MIELPPPLRIEPRWTDLDPVGHVNNNVFLVYAEEARARFLQRALPDAWAHIVVVHNGVDYHSSVVVTDTLEVTARVESIGRTSFTTLNTIATDTGRACATVRTVQVVLDQAQQRPRPWSEAELATLNSLSTESTVR